MPVGKGQTNHDRRRLIKHIVWKLIRREVIAKLKAVKRV